MKTFTWLFFIVLPTSIYTATLLSGTELNLFTQWTLVASYLLCGSYSWLNPPK